MNQPATAPAAQPAPLDVSKALEKVLEHIRQIHFLLLTVTLLLAYLTWATYQDTPHVLEELDRFETLLGRVSAVQEVVGRQGALTGDQRRQVTDLLATVNRHGFEVARDEFRGAIANRVGTTSIADTVPRDELLLMSAPTSMTEVSGKEQSIAVLFDQLDHLRVVIPVAIDLEFDKSLRLPSVHSSGYLHVSDMQPADAGRAKIKIISKIPDGQIVTRAIGNTGQFLDRTHYREVATDLVETTIKRSALAFIATPGFIKSEFPALSGLSLAWRDYPPRRLRELIKSDGERSVSSRSAKLFDIEVGGRDITTVAAVVIFTGLLYLSSFTLQAAQIAACATPETHVATVLARSVWIGTHEGPMSILVNASLLASVFAAVLGTWYFQGRSYGAACAVGGPVLLACTFALIAMQRLRLSLDLGPALSFAVIRRRDARSYWQR